MVSSKKLKSVVTILMFCPEDEKAFDFMEKGTLLLFDILLGNKSFKYSFQDV